jgi:syntaxin 1B/2/3
MNMKHFYEQCEEISNNTKKVEMFTSELDKLHKQALTTTGSEASSDTSSKIDIITAKVNQLSNQSRNTLKAIDLENSQLKEIAPPASGHMRMRESKHRALATAFLNATKKLQKLQQNYRDKYKQQLERQYKIVNPNATPEEVAQVTKDMEGAQAKIFATAVKDDAKRTLSQMKDRFQDVKTIETSILELHQLFLDLQTLIVEQGDIINRVDYNVDHTLDYTDEAAADMKLAVEYQKSIWKKKWIMIVLIIIGIIIVIVLLLWLLRPLFQLAATPRY